ncbi:hypothetical protein ACTFIW_005497 [Dictyostelium discoideum]
MSNTVNNKASSSSTSAANNAEYFDLKLKSIENQINNLSLAFTRFMKEPNQRSVFNFPSNLQVNLAPFDTLEGISVSSNDKKNDTDLLIVEKRINDSLKPLLLFSSMLSSDNSNVDVELISYLTHSVIILAVNAQASLSRVCRNNITKEIYGSKVLLPIKIKDTPKMFDETEI